MSDTALQVAMLLAIGAGMTLYVLLGARTSAEACGTCSPADPRATASAP